MLQHFKGQDQQMFVSIKPRDVVDLLSTPNWNFLFLAGKLRAGQTTTLTQTRSQYMLSLGVNYPNYNEIILFMYCMEITENISGQSQSHTHSHRNYLFFFMCLQINISSLRALVNFNSFSKRKFSLCLVLFSILIIYFLSLLPMANSEINIVSQILRQWKLSPSIWHFRSWLLLS